MTSNSSIDLYLATRKRDELNLKVASLETEFAHWRQVSQAEPYLKNHSQIHRVTAQLGGLQSRLYQWLDRDLPPLEFLGKARLIEEQILTVHCIWEFFRSKFILRRDDWFQRHLQACDELAWACYEPVLQQFRRSNPHHESDTKEPPLVFLNSGWSPFVLPRDKAFQAEKAPGGWIASEPFQAVLQKLPIPLIGIPWYSALHLPDAIVIAHEVGHLVELDFRLNLTEAFASLNLPSERQDTWMRWLREIFADLYGCLSLGSAYVESLVSLLSDNANSIAREIEFGVHPTRFLRVLINTTVLEKIGFAEDAQHIRDRWRQAYQEHAMAAFEPDVPEVVDTLLNSSHPMLGTSLPKILSFASRADKVQKIMSRLKRDLNLVKYALPQESQNTLLLFAAARRLYDEAPQSYRDTYGDKILSQIVDTREPGRRAGEPQTATSRLEQLEAADRNRGAALFETLFASMEG